MKSWAGDAPGQLPDRLHLLGLTELQLELLALLLFALSLRDVAGDAGDADELALIVELQSHGELAPDIAPVLAPLLCLVADEVATLAERLADELGDVRRAGRKLLLERTSAQHLLLAVAEHSLGGRTCVGERAIGSHLPDELGRALGHESVEALAAASILDRRADSTQIEPDESAGRQEDRDLRPPVGERVPGDARFRELAARLEPEHAARRGNRQEGGQHGGPQAHDERGQQDRDLPIGFFAIFGTVRFRESLRQSKHRRRPVV